MKNTRLGEDFLQNILQTTTSPQIIFSSNVTPDIALDLSEILSAKKQQPTTDESKKALKGSGIGSQILRLIRPEVIIETLGMEKSYAPYGHPYKQTYIFVLLGIGAVGILGASIGWNICRNKIGKKTTSSRKTKKRH